MKATEEMSSKRPMGSFHVCFQVSSRWALLLSLSRMFTAGPCTSEGCRRSTPASTAVWPPALPEPPLAPSVWRLEVRPHFKCST